MLRVALKNLNSIYNKLHYIKHFLEMNNIDIFALTETWLVKDTPDSFVTIPGYNFVRPAIGGCVRKHGVGLYLRSNLDFVTVDTDVPNLLAVHVLEFDFFLVLVYRPPSNSVHDNDGLLAFLLEFCYGREVLVLGGFNLPTIQWTDNLNMGTPCLADRGFLECFDSLGLTQWVMEPTYVPSGRTLDLVLTSESDRVGSMFLHPPFPGCGHVVVEFTYCFHMQHNHLDADDTVRLWHSGRYREINDYLGGVDWDVEFRLLDVEGMFGRFCSVLGALVDMYIPLRLGTPGRKPWPVRAPRQLLQRRAGLWTNYKTIRNIQGRRSLEALEALQLFQAANHEYRNFAVSSQIAYERSLADQLYCAPRLFHSYIRRKKVGQPQVGPIRLPSGDLVSDCVGMAEALAGAFAGVYARNPNLVPAQHRIFDGTMSELTFSVENVCELLDGLDGSSSMGPDGLHPLLLKSCSDNLAYPLHQIFTASLHSGRLPQLWKDSKVIPIFKKGSRYDPLNYRPISLTSVCCKTLERLVVKGLTEFLETNDLIGNNQFGFRSGRSVEDQLLLTYNCITEWVDRFYVVDLILFDFTKAFDKVNHAVLLRKLRLLGISGAVLEWISAFLQDRRMYVSVSGTHSSVKNVHSGVPQGSVLGPLLFLIYVDEVPKDISAHFKIFADDLKIYFRVSDSSGSAVDAVERGQRDIDRICMVAASWGLTMNAAKCSVLRFQRGPRAAPAAEEFYSLGGERIEFVNAARDLGIIVDYSLRFHDHVADVTRKANAVASNLLRSTLCRSESFMVQLYTTHVRPLLEFASCIWNTGYVGDVKKLEAVQRRWTREIEGFGGLTYGERLDRLEMYSVKGRLMRIDLIKYWKILHGESVINREEIFEFPPHVGTRGHDYKLAHRYCSLEARRRFFSFRWVSLWNSLPAHLVLVDNLAAFKRGLHDFLGPRLYDYYD